MSSQFSGQDLPFFRSTRYPFLHRNDHISVSAAALIPLFGEGSWSSYYLNPGFLSLGILRVRHYCVLHMQEQILTHCSLPVSIDRIDCSIVPSGMFRVPYFQYINYCHCHPQKLFIDPTGASAFLDAFHFRISKHFIEETSAVWSITLFIGDLFFMNLV